MPDTIIDLQLPNEPRHTLVIRLRHRPDGNSTYQARRMLPMDQRKNPRNPYKTHSLNTDDLEKAKTLAYQWERGIHGKIERNEPLNQITFRSTADSYLRWAAKRLDHVDRSGQRVMSPNALKREETCLRRYLIPFFGERDLRTITVTDIERYIEWRMDYYIDGPGAEEVVVPFQRGGKTYTRPSARNPRPARSTVNKDAVAYGKILKHARRTDNLSIVAIPRIIIPKSRSEQTSRRPRFDDDECELLIETATERCVMSSGWACYHRHVLWGFLELLFGTGIRVSEAMWLQVKHLKLVPVTDRYQEAWDRTPETWDDDGVDAYKGTSFPLQNGKLLEYRVQVAPDNGGLKQADHARTVIPTANFSERFVLHLGFLAGHFRTVLGDHIEGYNDLPRDLFLFPNPRGERLKSMRRSFGELLDAAISPNHPEGLRKKDGKARPLSSIRHTYASKQIETGATRVSVGFLADNMGTSTEMIRKHYGQALRELRAEDLQNY